MSERSHIRLLRRLFEVTTLGAALAWAGPALALQPLDEFVKGSRTANLDAREAKLGIEQRSREREVALGRVLPTLRATATYQRNQFKAEVSVPSQAGQPPTTVTITPEDQLDAQVQLTVPLVDVGGWVRVSAARATEDAARVRLSATSSDVEGEVARAYYQLVGARWLEEAAQKSVSVAEQNLEVLRVRKEAGVAFASDLARAEAEVARAKQSVSSARYESVSAARQLETLTGVTPSTGAPTLDAPTTKELEKAAVEKGARETPQVLAAQAEVRAASRTRDASYLSLVPTVSAFANERLTNATGFAGQSSIYALGVTATFQLDYTTIAQARLADTQVAIAKVRAERAVSVQKDLALDAWDRVRAQAERSKAARAEEAASKKAAELVRERLAGGSATLLEAVQSDRDAFSATVSRIQADADLAYARVLLDLRAGKKAGSP
jgi:outer membrane protein TolC